MQKLKHLQIFLTALLKMKQLTQVFLKFLINFRNDSTAKKYFIVEEFNNAFVITDFIVTLFKKKSQ